ncbi:MAG: hypothetical protein E2586_16475 [Novosphingobium sp.]|uniref:anti-sigma factor n=1 Tax=Novosphingobium sp. TaxID=1874826 RepID=UPI0012C184AB|nr:anti-sigma factor [Novosphingobium sp.]MPS70076.1 hypothetical protein [Novosphingobium sp.]
MADPADPFGRSDVAAELALGLLEGEDRAAAQRLRLSDPVFAGEVDAWAARLSPLLAAIPAAEPPTHLWDKVAARIDSGAPRNPEPALIRRLRAWRAGAIFAASIAACLALFILVRPAEDRTKMPMSVSQLAGAEGSATMAVAYDPKAGMLHLSPHSLGGNGKSPELWVIPEDGVPRSLGVMQSAVLAISPDMRPMLTDGATLAITLEDSAGAPHKAPSTAPILTGKITTI